MYGTDILAVIAIVFGAYLGARKGLWRLAAGGGAVGLGAAAGWATCDVLAAALGDWGVGAPGNAILGFFLPFALTSVYARFVIGLWLSRKLDGRPAHNRLLGAAAGVVWMVFLSGLLARAAGLGGRAEGAAAYGAEPGGPVTSWLARWPGELGARTYLSALTTAREAEITSALREALDTDRARRRAGGADADAITSVREAGFVRLRVDAPATD
jgi:hypothetical protein